MRRGRHASSPSPYRALAHHNQHAGSSTALSDSSSLIRSFNVEANPARPVRPSPLAASTIRDMPLDLVDRIRSFPLFQSAPGEFLIAIGNHLKPQVHGPNDHIVTEGDNAKAMYWLVRGVVAVTSRDGEAVYAELKPGAFFGEIGVLMNMPRTATIVARTKCLLLVLKKEDLQLIMPKFPDMEKAILEEAQERLNLLKKKKRQDGRSSADPSQGDGRKGSTFAPRATAPGEVSTGESGVIKDGTVVKNPKKRKSPSPGIIEDPASGGSAIGSGLVNIRKTLKELPLFSTLPPDILHFLGLSAQPKTWPPFTDIIQQGSSGHEIYFMVQGEAEVVHQDPAVDSQIAQAPLTPVGPMQSHPRLKSGQYFGEVASLGLSSGRTATVRSITTVECLVIPGEVLDELWQRCPPGIKSQVEETARMRYNGRRRSDGAEDIDMTEPVAMSKPIWLQNPPTTPPANRVSMSDLMQQHSPSRKDDTEMMEPKDPDPFLSVNMENLRNRRRQSLAPPTHAGPPTPPTPSSEPTTPSRLSGLSRQILPDSIMTPVKLDLAAHSPPDSTGLVRAKRAKTLTKLQQPIDLGIFSAPAAAAAARCDAVLVSVFKHLDIGQLARMRIISRRWRQILTTSPDVCHDVNLSRYNRRVNDDVIIRFLAPFVGTRARAVDLSNCFHVTDEGFSTLWRSCGRNVKEWRMRSVWDVSATQILEMSENSKNLEEIDWSNCRKVGDNLLGRVVGWVISGPSAAGVAAAMNRKNGTATASSKPMPQSRDKRRSRRMTASQPAPSSDGKEGQTSETTQQNPNAPAPTTVVIGCPKLSKLNLSYCKHITDRSMAHLAAHASNRLQSLSLTRCTSITDAGFQTWAAYKFAKLTHLCLADCTYLSDNAIVALVNAAKNLTHLDLSFCCALSDTSTEVVALGLPKLRELRLAFCGSAVSDGSLESIAVHLNELEGLSVRGCVRVTGRGLESVLQGCSRLEWVDVSQCRNLESWLRVGSVSSWGFDDRAARLSAKPNFNTAPPPLEPQFAIYHRDRMGEPPVLLPKKTMSVATTLSTPRYLPQPNIGGFLGRRKRLPVRFIVEKGLQGLR
ncbi:hypothetical protein HIM_04594 [Hirsutella minnesotensis 3608]|uniref:Cyclic nucleotide-binding domain-containing protein n=1 Tax=Hirsutella minnesotensis 3608 TaxID=1043627 RepID=A0A0F7ZV78_9HYPO|nr:hypothetical protein HIM_04594 [Hirsutella minnesotensis 3608]